MRNLAKFSIPRRAGRIAAALLLSPIGAVAAKAPADVREYYAFYQSPAGNLISGQSDYAAYQGAGTLEREGLGASPLNPEGPGNVED